MKKRFSMRSKLLIIFGVLIAVAAIIEGLLAVQIARKAVIEKIEKHLTDKATDVAEVIDGRINALFQFVKGLARMPVFTDTTVSYGEKVTQLAKETAFSNLLYDAVITDTRGNMYTQDNRSIDIHNYDWYKASISGKDFLTEPFISATDGKLILTIAVPIYNSDKQIAGVLAAAIPAQWLSDQIDDIVVGNTGECYILGLEGSAAAHKSSQMVENRYNPVEEGKKDKQAASLGSFVKHALETDESEVGYYEFKGVSYIASYATMKTTDWTVIIKAPVHEFMGTVDNLRNRIFIIGIVILATALAVTFLVVRRIVKPINVVVDALKDIAHGEGDLTVRLPLIPTRWRTSAVNLPAT